MVYYTSDSDIQSASPGKMLHSDESLPCNRCFSRTIQIASCNPLTKTMSYFSLQVIIYYGFVISVHDDTEISPV